VITVFGSANLDLIGTVTRLPKPGETVPGGAFKTAAGGKGANAALAARRAGADVRMFGAVGSDSFAAEALTELQGGRGRPPRGEDRAGARPASP
jgi:ribokinase